MYPINICMKGCQAAVFGGGSCGSQEAGTAVGGGSQGGSGGS